MKPLENQSQIILRQQHLVLNQVLLLCPPADDLASYLQQSATVTTVKALTWDYSSYLHLQSKTETLYSLNISDQWQPNQVIMFMPKSRKVLALMLAVLNPIWNRLEKVWLVGEKREGIESSAKHLLKGIAREIVKLDSARHCQLWELKLDGTGCQPISDHWQQDTLQLPESGSMDIHSLPGVFSQGRLDSGTELLLSALPELNRLNTDESARVLDFGCGYGVIGFYLKRLYNRAQVEMLDTNLLALESVKKTNEQNGLAVKVFPSSGLSAVQKGLTAIVTNPPFHQGVKKDVRTTHQFLRDCAAYLVRQGTLTLVANRFLPYAGWIEGYLGRPEILAENNQFKVYHVLKS